MDVNDVIIILLMLCSLKELPTARQCTYSFSFIHAAVCETYFSNDPQN